MNNTDTRERVMCNIIRDNIERVKTMVKTFSDDLGSDKATNLGDKGEQIANAILAFRHLEDAKMRIGKVIQAIEGQSVYDQ